MKKFIPLAFVLFSQSILHAEEESPKQVPIVMYEFLGKLSRLQPYIASKKKFMEKRNEKEIDTQLSEFAGIAKRLDHSKRLNTPSFQISAEALQ